MKGTKKSFNNKRAQKIILTFFQEIKDILNL